MNCSIFKRGDEMIICRNCNTPMENVMSFSKDKNEKFSRCPKCFSETKYTNIQVGELTFGEYLYRELNKKGHIK